MREQYFLRRFEPQPVGQLLHILLIVDPLTLQLQDQALIQQLQ